MKNVEFIIMGFQFHKKDLTTDVPISTIKRHIGFQQL